MDKEPIVLLYYKLFPEKYKEKIKNGLLKIRCDHDSRKWAGSCHICMNKIFDAVSTAIIRAIEYTDMPKSYAALEEEIINLFQE